MGYRSHIRIFRGFIALGLTLCAATPSMAQVFSTEFQNGLNGYSGTFIRRISSQLDQEHNGIDVASFYVDGFSQNTGTSTTNGSDDQQALIRFDNLVGGAANQIPTGATILDAKLTLTTSLAGNADSPGPFGVSGMLQAFDENTSYTSFSSTTDYTTRGAWWEDGSATRPTGGIGVKVEGDVARANITSVVQAWVDGTYANNGLVVQAGMNDSYDDNTWGHTTNGWSFRSTGYPFSDSRPKIEVTYTTGNVESNEFQSSTMAIVRSGDNALVNDTETGGEETIDASTVEQVYLDGIFFNDINGNVSSPDHFGLLKFDDVFGEGSGQAPSDVPVAKAWMVLTTANTTTAEDNSSQSSGPYSAYTMKRSWDTTSLHSSFGDVNGLQVGDGDIGAALDTLEGFILGAEAYFDVTDYLEGVRNGETDNGIAVVADGSQDGWQIYTNGSSDQSVRPRLIVYSADLEVVVPGLPGDFNDDGYVDAADYTVWRNNLGADESLLGGNGDGSGTIDIGDYTAWKANFGATSAGALGLDSGSNVPEPATVALLAVAATAVIGLRRRLAS